MRLLNIKCSIFSYIGIGNLQEKCFMQNHVFLSFVAKISDALKADSSNCPLTLYIAFS